MADDKNLDQDPEENRHDHYDDDDDFGLPDLEFTALEEDDEFGDEFDIPSANDEPQDDEISEEVSAGEEISFDGSGDDEFNLDDIDLDDINVDDIDMDDIDMDDIDLSDIEGMDLDISDEDLEKELNDMDSGGLDLGGSEDYSPEATEEKVEPSETPDFYQEETYDDFEEPDVLTSVFGKDEPSDATEERYVPVKDKSGKVHQEKDRLIYSEKGSGKEKGNFNKVVIFGTILILVVASVLWVMNGNEGKVKPKKTPAAVVKKEEPKVVEVKPVVEEPKVEEVQPEPQNTTPLVAGSVTQLPNKTGNTYVIVSSFVDSDLAMDYANELAAGGKSPMIIPPFSRHRFFRVAIAEFSTFDEAKGKVDDFKAEFGQDVWVLRY